MGLHGEGQAHRIFFVVGSLPGVSTASLEVTGVLAEGGVPFGERSEPTFLFRRAASEENFGPKGRFP